MNTLLVRAIILASLADLGIQYSDLSNLLAKPSTRNALMRSVVNMPWKPISVFPNEARKFAPKPRTHGCKQAGGVKI